MRRKRSKARGSFKASLRGATNMSKGSRSRITNLEKYRANYEKIFGKEKPQPNVNRPKKKESGHDTERILETNKDKKLNI